MVNIIIGVVGALLIRRLIEGAAVLKAVKQAQDHENWRLEKEAEIKAKQVKEWYE